MARRPADRQDLDVFTYIDYRCFLRDFYAYHKKNSRHFSYRYFAQKAGFASHNVFKMVMRGQRNLAEESIAKFCGALKLDEKESRYFSLMVRFCQARSEQEKNGFFREMVAVHRGAEGRRLDELQYRMYSEWYHPVVRELITLKDFPDDPRAAAKMISPPITPSQLRRSLKLLEEIGLIKKGDDGRWVQCNQVVKCDPDVLRLSIRNFNRQMIRFGEQAIEAMAPEDREISALTLGVSRSLFQRLKQRVREFKDELLGMAASDTSPSEEVCQLNVQLFPIVKKHSGAYRKPADGSVPTEILPGAAAGPEEETP